MRDAIDALIDFDRVRACTDVEIFISATNVWTGKVTIFKTQELTADHLMASACLPTVFQAVEIDGVPYWDGGYMGNPALFPLFDETMTDDILLVQINPLERRQTKSVAVPRTTSATGSTHGMTTRSRSAEQRPLKRSSTPSPNVWRGFQTEEIRRRALGGNAQNQCRPLSSAAAQPGSSDSAATLLQFQRQVQGNPGAGHAERMTDGDGAAVDVHLRRIQAQCAR